MTFLNTCTSHIQPSGSDWCINTFRQFQNIIYYDEIFEQQIENYLDTKLGFCFESCIDTYDWQIGSDVIDCPADYVNI